MTQSDRMEILRRAVKETSQAEVARRIGMSPAVISNLVNEKYTGDVEGVLELIEAEFGASTVNCPVLGPETPLADCLDARRRAERPFIATSGQSTKLYFACPTCGRRKA